MTTAIHARPSPDRPCRVSAHASVSMHGLALGVLAAVLCLGAATPAAAQWKRLDSPNFIVIGDAAARDLRDIAVKFEGFRETLGRLLGERVTVTAVPTVVVIFPSDTAMGPFRPKFQGKPVDAAGLFVPGRDVNYIAMVNDGNAARLRVVFHEYTHLMMSNLGQQLPVWLNEGLAEYYSTFELGRDGREAVLGGLIESHLARLNDTKLIPLDDLLKIDHQSPLYNEGSRRSVFYAQAWALTHLIVLGEPNRVPQMSAYLANLAAGDPATQAWQQAFGTLNMQRALEDYIRHQLFSAYKYKFSDAVARFEAPAVPIAPAEVQAYLAGLLVQLGEHDAASVRLDQAKKLDAINPRLGVGLVGLGLARKASDGDDARLRAMTTPSDWFLAYLAGVAASGLAERRDGPPTVQDLDTVRRFFTAAHAGHAEFLNAVGRLAELELRSEAGPTAETSAALEAARLRAPSRHEYAFLHAQVLVRRSQFAQARGVIEPFIGGAYAASVRSAARSLMGFIVQMENSRKPGANPGPDAPASSNMRPVFRTLQPGEERLEGTLELIECVQGRGITFHVKSGGSTVTASAPSMAGVAFITYRNDLTGNVKCGALNPPMAVYLTWRPGPEESGTKIAVAIEFLPKAPASVIGLLSVSALSRVA